MRLRRRARPELESFHLANSPVRSHIIVARGASATIGLGVSIGAGFSLSCSEKVTIGDHVSIGPFVQILDGDLHTPGDLGRVPQPRAVRIGRGAAIGPWSTLLPGSDVGEGAVVEPYSVVSGLVPPGRRAAGNPAVVLAAPAPSGGESSGSGLALVQSTVQATFGLAALPDPGTGRDAIEAWTSLGALRLLAELRRILDTPLPEAEVLAAWSIEELGAIVERARSL